MNKVWIMFCLLMMKNGYKRADFLRKHSVFGGIGDSVSFRPYNIPSEPKLLFLGNNVWIAADVRFITHDMANQMLHVKGIPAFKELSLYTNEIHVGDNVLIGANSIICPGKRIGNNTIVAAGSVVTKDIPDNEVWGGNPAKYICSFDEFVKRREAKLRENV